MLAIALGLVVLFVLSGAAWANDTGDSGNPSEKNSEASEKVSDPEPGEEKIELKRSDWDAERNREYERGKRKAMEDAAEKEKQATEERLRAEGKTKELLETKEKELADLKNQVVQAKFRSDATDIFAKAGLTGLEEIALTVPVTAEGVTQAAETLRLEIEKRVTAEVDNRLKGTPTPKSTGEGPSIQYLDDFTSVEQKAAYVAKYGADAFGKLTWRPPSKPK